METVSRTSLTQMPVAQCNYHFGSCTAARIPPQMQDISAKLVLFTSPPKKRPVSFVSRTQLTRVPCRQQSQDEGLVDASLHSALDAKAMPGKDNMKHQGMDLDH